VAVNHLPTLYSAPLALEMRRDKKLLSIARNMAKVQWYVNGCVLDITWSNSDFGISQNQQSQIIRPTWPRPLTLTIRGP